MTCMHFLQPNQKIKLIKYLIASIAVAEEDTTDWIAFYRQKRGKDWIKKDLAPLKFIKHTIYLIEGRDKGPITRNVQSNKRKANAQVKKSNVTKSTVKCRRANSNKKTKTIVTRSDSDDNCDNNNKENLNLNFNELEYRERELALKEREIY
ncbi:hypothetical protein RhiirA5_464711 [Rhizophagus irregularis]|uniref:Uncharacterized protein n=1 Tax=Rhizophagus irregularis TaxID=588596 RepID=A0A2I1EY30_9GLOM|nr:hypothetical protein RhiirA5_464711 [Rhizophagus irregularis]PKY27008.1 hypothetical protein RhiirB3_477520 [Rhizophagus irregularis]CAB4491688.1 unnamed protein product [Rhizophagus irregularis]